jgi:hypothetical protein
MIVTVVGLFGVGTMLDSSRFADLSTASEERGALIKRPELFTRDDRHLLSSRAYIWSQYYYSWVDAPARQKLLGFGPESWVGKFTVYAHNTLVSSLYEFGVLGIVATLALWLSMLGIAALAKAGPRFEMLAAHISYLTLNMATMPMWQIEGIIYYSILCGYTVYWYDETRRMKASRFAQKTV